MATNQEEYDEWNDAGEEDEGPDMMIIGGAVIVGILVILGLSAYMGWCCFKPEEKATKDNKPEEKADVKKFKEVIKEYVLTDIVIQNCESHMHWIIVPDFKPSNPKNEDAEAKNKREADEKEHPEKKETRENQAKDDFDLANVNTLFEPTISMEQMKIIRDGEAAKGYLCIRFNHYDGVKGNFKNWIAVHDQSKNLDDAKVETLFTDIKEEGKANAAVVKVTFKEKKIEKLDSIAGKFKINNTANNHYLELVVPPSNE